MECGSSMFCYFSTFFFFFKITLLTNWAGLGTSSISAPPSVKGGRETQGKEVAHGTKLHTSLAGVTKAQAGIFSEPHGLGGRERGVNIY
jgi:hypothetical protein